MERKFKTKGNQTQKLPRISTVGELIKQLKSFDADNMPVVLRNGHNDEHVYFQFSIAHWFKRNYKPEYHPLLHAWLSKDSIEDVITITPWLDDKDLEEMEEMNVYYPEAEEFEIGSVEWRKYITKMEELKRRSILSTREKLSEFFNGPSSAYAPDYRKDHFWKPLWRLFLTICVIYTIMNIAP